MFYKMIERKRDEWYTSTDCTVNSIIDYIVQAGYMRDAQIDAIKTYLFLKIKCGCAPLETLFANGAFNTLNLDEAALPTTTRDYLKANPVAAALYEYACQRNDANEQVSEKLEKAIKDDPDSIDYRKFFHEAFYEVSYTDYLFSLPMGAGKTYLMAAFIYLDLYFAMNEPQNPAFAHNFIIFAPSGLKSSVVPSLKTIQKFDPSWVLPEPAASDIKRMIAFEVLDEGKSAKKSNKTKNPNVQKIANHQPLSELFGLVAVTNAEKVILDGVEETNGQIDLLASAADKNELRALIGKIPKLSVFIDEVHHAASSADKAQERKLRAVVNHWTETGSVNSVVGFSGTPYLEKADKVKVNDDLTVASAEITNIVYYYPLINGVGSFLKLPVVKIAEIADSSRIIEKGVREFLETYKDKVYDGGLTAKLGIYCGTIEKLEELVYPIVARIVRDYGLSTDCILKFYRESSSKDKAKKKYIAPADSQMQFDILDSPLSKIRIVLLVQIGKEGWDCRSLTGIILSQEGDCPKNMVLQTSCRCLRQVVKGQPETALIYLNKDNGEKLESQLKQQQHISIKELEQGSKRMTELKRYDRTAYLKLPKIDFYQLKVNYETQTLEAADPAKAIPQAPVAGTHPEGSVREIDFSLRGYGRQMDDDERGSVHTTFDSWLADIVREGLYTTSFGDLAPHEAALRTVFETITYPRGGGRCFSSKFDVKAVNAAIRKAFSDKRDFTSTEELIQQESSLLNIANFKPTVQTETPDAYIPDQEEVEKIRLADSGKLKMKPDIADAIAKLEADDSPINKTYAQTLRLQNSAHPHRDRTFHYLPYHTDSGFERRFFDDILELTAESHPDLEVYYNGERSMTEFKIKCYKRSGAKWNYIGLYTPDFLIIRRKDGKIHKAVIVETKGEAYKEKFADKRKFMADEFCKLNNERFGYERFEFLYLEDSIKEDACVARTYDRIREFFGRPVNEA